MEIPRQASVLSTSDRFLSSPISRWLASTTFFILILAADAALLAASPHRNVSIFGLFPGSRESFIKWVCAWGFVGELALAATIHTASRVMGGREPFSLFGPCHLLLSGVVLIILMPSPWAPWLLPVAAVVWSGLSLGAISFVHRLPLTRSLFAWLFSLPMQMSAVLVLLLLLEQAVTFERLQWTTKLATAHQQALDGHMNDAERSLKEALTLASAFNAKSADVGRIDYELGVFYESSRRNDQALLYYRRAEPILRQSFGLTSRPYWDCIARQAEISELSGRWSDAEALYSTLLQLMDSERGENHPFSIGYLNALGRLAFVQGRYEQAESYYRQGLAIAQDIPSSAKPAPNDFRVTLVNALAYTFAAEGKAADLATLLSSYPTFGAPIGYQVRLWTEWSQAAIVEKDKRQAENLLERCIIVAKAMPPGDPHLQKSRNALEKFRLSHGNAASRVP